MTDGTGRPAGGAQDARHSDHVDAGDLRGGGRDAGLRPGLFPTATARMSADGDALLFELGPFELPARSTHHQVRQSPPQLVRVPRAGWLHGFEVEIVDGRGRAVPQQDVLHHLNVIAPAERELFSHIMLRIAAAGEETAEVSLPPVVGVRVQDAEPLLLSIMLTNPTPTAWHDVTVRARFPFVPESGPLRPLSAQPFYLDVMPPAGLHAYDLPPGRSTRSWEASPAIAGRILGVGGHLHAYGVELRLTDVTADEVIWRATPEHTESGRIDSIPTQLFWPVGVPIEPDHTYRLTAVYENPTGAPIPNGAMGALGGLFVPAPGTDWPAVDTSHPQYRADLQTLMGGHDEEVAPADPRVAVAPADDGVAAASGVGAAAVSGTGVAAASEPEMAAPPQGSGGRAPAAAGRDVTADGAGPSPR